MKPIFTKTSEGNIRKAGSKKLSDLMEMEDGKFADLIDVYNNREMFRLESGN